MMEPLKNRGSHHQPDDGTLENKRFHHQPDDGTLETQGSPSLARFHAYPHMSLFMCPFRGVHYDQTYWPMGGFGARRACIFQHSVRPNHLRLIKRIPTIILARVSFTIVVGRSCHNDVIGFHQSCQRWLQPVPIIGARKPSTPEWGEQSGRHPCCNVVIGFHQCCRRWSQYGPTNDAAKQVTSE